MTIGNRVKTSFQPLNPDSRFHKGPWRSNGWGFLAVSWPGYPGSTGSPTQASLYATGESATQYAIAHAPGSAILYHAHSLGTGVAIDQAMRHSSKGLYLEAPYSSIADVAHGRFWLWPAFLVADEFRSDLRIPFVRAPMLFVHGDQDAVVPLQFGQKLYRSVRPSPENAFDLLSGGDHLSVFGARDDEAERKFRDAAAVAPAKD